MGSTPNSELTTPSVKEGEEMMSEDEDDDHGDKGDDIKPKTSKYV